MEGFIYFVLFCACYFAPTWIAARGLRGSVFVLNLFLGFTGIGWVAALYLAIRSRETVKEVA